MEKRGNFAVVGSDRRGLLLCLHVGPLESHGAQVFEPHGGRERLFTGCRCFSGSRDSVSTPWKREVAWPLESSPENSPPRPQVPKSVLSTLSVLGWECCRAVLPRGNRVVL